MRKRINESPARSPLPPQNDPKPRLKRFLNAQGVTDIAARYEAGETTQQIGNRYGISKSRVTTILREQGIAIRRQGLNEERISEAATLYAAGRSLAWLGARYGISHTTVAAALRRQGMHLRPRPGWSYASLIRGDTRKVSTASTVFGTVTGPSGSVSFALSDANNGVAIDELDVAERTCSAAGFDPVRNSQN
jgi:hypothetical protein